MMQKNKNFFERYLPKLPLAFLLLFTGLAALVLFGYMAHEVLGEQEDNFDLTIFQYLRMHVISDRLTAFMKAVTMLASQIFLIPAYSALIIMYLVKNQKRRAVEIFMIGAIGFLINNTMKHYFHRNRPDLPLVSGITNFSFPSGHAMSAFVFYGLLIYLLWRSATRRSFKILGTGFLLMLSLLIGFSRVYLRVHYPSDVISGFCIGLAWICFAIWVLERVKTSAKKEAVTKGEAPV